MNAAIDFDVIRNKAIDGGFRAFSEGDFHDAEEIFEQYLNYDEARIGMSMVLFNAGKPNKALDIIDGIQTLDAVGARCTLYKELNDPDRELDSLRQFYELSSGNNWKLYAEALIAKELYSEAVKVLLDAGTEYSHVLLADCYIHEGELEKARDLLKTLVTKNKNCVGALLELCGIATEPNDITPDTAAILNRILKANATHVDTESTLRGNLGKVYELQNRLSDACVEYNKFFDLEFAKVNPQVFEARLSAEHLGKTYDREFISRVPESTEHCPLIFVMGMPRSGTTLIEQTLISHSKIETRGETTGISEMIDDIQKGKVRPKSPEEAWAYYRDKFGLEDTDGYIIDKMPGNFHFIGIIYQLFPNAKFIYSHRNPLDNCVGCMTTHFNQGHPYSKDPEQMALEYNNHVGVINMWKDIMPAGTIFDLAYEDNVADHEQETRRLLDFIGLEFEESCEKFYELKRDVRTASMAQVIKPIYTSSVGRGLRMVNADIDTGAFTKLKEKLNGLH